MRVKIGDQWYDSNDQPICIQVSEWEQRVIGDMDRKVAKEGKVGFFGPSIDWGSGERRNWMAG